MREAALLAELAPTVERLLDHHLSTSREWFPHELVPWGRGRDFDPDEPWNPSECPLPEAVRSALYVNLLTEDNLPYYFNQLDTQFPGEAWGAWARRWTAEENRHSIVIRDWIMITRAVDPVELERARMAQMSGGVVPHPVTALDSIIYVTLQELATRVAHRNTGLLLEDEAGLAIMSRVATDENFHHLFYRELAAAAKELDPSGFVCALERQVREFEMPGTGIVDFASHAAAIASAGIYDFAVHHEKVLKPVIGPHWCIEELQGLDDEAERAREAVFSHMDRVERVGQAMRDRRGD